MTRERPDPAARAAAAWGDPLPDWIAALARACAETSQARVAQKIGMTDGVVSQVLAGKYPGNMAGVEARVRGVFLDGRVDCPALGEISSKACEDWRRKARAFVLGDPTRERMYRACRRCPRFTEGATQ